MASSMLSIVQFKKNSDDVNIYYKVTLLHSGHDRDNCGDSKMLL